VKIAVVYQVWNPGGLTRFTHALMDGLLEADREVTIDYYVASSLLQSGRIPTFKDPSRVRTIGISDPDVINSNQEDPDVAATWWRPIARGIVRRLAGQRLLYDAVRGGYRIVLRLVSTLSGRKRGKNWNRFSLQPDVVAALVAYDVVYLPFPFHLEPAALKVPVVATFHDMNHRYFAANFGRRGLRELEHQLDFWTARADMAVVSTRYVESDLLKFYPSSAGRTEVVFVAPYSLAPMSKSVRLAALERLRLRDQDYLVYPANNSVHKGLMGLCQAADLLKRAGRLAHPIVITGFGTDGLGKGKWPSFAELDTFLASSSLTLGEDVRGLGFVTDEEVDALTRSARLVVSTSLYEAGCGPALDAWQFGVPVAFSNIPPFLEQLDALDVEAWSFDPKDPEDIAQVVWRALDEWDESLAMAARSKEAIKHYTWDQAAQSYLGIFAHAIEHYRDGRANPS
jgi:hypothetical protein